MSEPILQVRNLSVHYGGIQAVRGIEFSLNEGEQGTLLGANGAGKSSTVRAIAGLQPYGGEILWQGKSIHRRAPQDLLRDGIVLVPAGRGIFTRVTVEENLLMGAWRRKGRQTVKQEMAQLYARFPRLG